MAIDQYHDAPRASAPRTHYPDRRPPVSRRLPPLNALRTFEAAARHLSFTRAADELHVTPAAVGQQVRLLEGHLGQPLFHRERRRLILTAAGHACLPGIRDGFAKLAAAVQESLTHSPEGDLP